MKNKLVKMISLFLVFCLALSGCGMTGLRDGGSSQDEISAAGKETTETALQPEGEAAMHTYSTQEIWVSNGDLKIYGIAYVPDANGKMPLVIFSHELGNDHKSGVRYAERLAEAGYAAYVFDFCGGTVGGNKSDGRNREMSVLTEASDLKAVLESAKSWDFVDPDKIVLLGGSMGGLVTTVVGCTHQDEIAGMILLYPALSAKADSRAEGYQTEDEVPEDVSLFGGWIHVGKNYITDLWKVDFDQLLSSYQGHMLLLHGDQDGTVPISWSENVKEIIPDCEFYVIKNGGHEFFGQPFEDAMSYILPYLDRQLNNEKAESEGIESMLRMKIGETDVAVDWEDNESVEALKELCRDESLTIQMSMYGGFEQVGPIGQSLPRNDSQTTTQAGDIVLYSGNQIVVFYGSNSWAYTRLGHISDKTAQDLADLLGGGDVTITIGRG